MSQVGIQYFRWQVDIKSLFQSFSFRQYMDFIFFPESTLKKLLESKFLEF
jgi:hypothetical protein